MVEKDGGNPDRIETDDLSHRNELQLPLPSTIVAPRTFSLSHGSEQNDPYLSDPVLRLVVGFFEAKGLAVIKDEDRQELWYADWLAFQADHQIYAQLLTPRRYSSTGGEFNLLRLTRFLEVFGYFSPAHGYSLQVTFLGLFPILMGTNEALKSEAIAILEAGGVLGLGVSEEEHGADLLGNQFTITPTAPGWFAANGSKFFIGNANCAGMISILARQVNPGAQMERRSPFALFVLRPGQAPGYGQVRKIHTLGVRSAFVGEFKVHQHELPESDIFAQNRNAWDALLGTIVLGKFFLGFGAIGICEHALSEAATHLGHRQLYGKPALEMPHLSFSMSLAYARVLAMKLYAYRALDYVQTASEKDRRYLLFAAVQKAKVSTEGVNVLAILSECIGARGFNAQTYFEMALRDIMLIPAVEGSTHINLGQVAQFLRGYFIDPDRTLCPLPGSSPTDGTPAENDYLFKARTGAINTVRFPPPLAAYTSFKQVPNMQTFGRQVRGFSKFLNACPGAASSTDERFRLSLGRCGATIVYGQLIAEQANLQKIDPELVSLVFHVLVTDLSTATYELASLTEIDAPARLLLRRCLAVPKTVLIDWASASIRIDGLL